LRCPSGARLTKQNKKKKKEKRKGKKRLNEDGGLCCEGLECLAEELSTLVDCSVELYWRRVESLELDTDDRWSFNAKLSISQLLSHVVTVGPSMDVNQIR
jgi:intein/homing endonuclease